MSLLGTLVTLSWPKTHPTNLLPLCSLSASLLGGRRDHVRPTESDRPVTRASNRVFDIH